ncbi:MAG: MFS transporter [Clostridiaceae bacterium]
MKQESKNQLQNTPIENPDELKITLEEKKRGFRNILLLGLTSLFMDASTEMVYPLIPLYLVTAFGATPALVGVIEGIAESLASLMKVFSGYLGDRYKRKKALTIVGYSTALVYKVALILSASWAGVLFARIIDRFGKGVRVAPRDAMVSENAVLSRQGTAFGLHKALDMAGSAIGVLAAYFILRVGTTTGDYQRVFLYSLIPAVCGMIVLSFVREKKHAAVKKAEKHPRVSWKSLDLRLRLFLITAFVFNLGNSSNTFLLLRSYDVGYDAVSVILLYLLYNVVSSMLSLPMGKLSDKIGKKRLLVYGYLAFSLTYLGFALVKSGVMLMLLFALYGVYTAMTAGVERALIAVLSPPEHKGAVLGLHGTLTGIALLPASVLAGALWNAVSASAPFFLGAALSFVAMISIAIIFRSGRQQSV